MVNDPDLWPIAVGLNTTLTVQLAFGARLLPQVRLEITKSPTTEIEKILSPDVSLFTRVNLRVTLRVSRTCSPLQTPLPMCCAAYASGSGCSPPSSDFTGD